MTLLPLDLICQAILAYEAFKALKAPPPSRRRRQANLDPRDGDAARTSTSHAAVQRRRKMKQMLKAWLVYIIAAQLERALDVCCGWWFPFYSTCRAMLFLGWIVFHKVTGEIAFAQLLVPAMRPYEKSLDWLHALLVDILDISYFVLASVLAFAASPFQAASQRILRAWRYVHPIIAASSSTISEDEIEGDKDKVAGVDMNARTPRARRTARKPRLSQMATPYVPGHLVAEVTVRGAQGIARSGPPVRPRVPPAEMSLDDLPAFMEAMDRAQAAFYDEEESAASGAVGGDSAGKRLSGKNRVTARVAGTAAFGQNGAANHTSSPQGEKRARRTLETLDEEIADLSPAKRRRVAQVMLPATAMTNAPTLSAKAKGKRKAVDSDAERQALPSDLSAKTRSRVKRVPIASKERPAQAGPSVSAPSRLPKRSAAQNAKDPTAAESTSVAQSGIDRDKHLERESAAAARRRERQAKSAQAVVTGQTGAKRKKAS